MRWPLVVLALFVLCTRFSRGQIESSGSSVIRSIDAESLFPEESFDEDRFLLPFVEEKVDYALGLVELAPRCVRSSTRAPTEAIAHSHHRARSFPG